MKTKSQECIAVAIGEMGRPRLSDAPEVPRPLVISLKANPPGKSSMPRPARHQKWRHVSASEAIVLKPTRTHIPPAAMVRLVAYKRRKLLGPVLAGVAAELERVGRRRQARSPRQWKLVVLNGWWLKTTVHAADDRTTVIFMDATFTFVRAGVPVA